MPHDLLDRCPRGGYRQGDRASFDQIFRSEGVDIVRLPFRSRRGNSIAERFVAICRKELLDHLLIFSADHLEAVIKEFLDHYHHARPH